MKILVLVQYLKNNEYSKKKEVIEKIIQSYCDELGMG